MFQVTFRMPGALEISVIVAIGFAAVWVLAFAVTWSNASTASSVSLSKVQSTPLVQPVPSFTWLAETTSTSAPFISSRPKTP